MTHPLRDSKKDGRRQRVKQGEPFDPEELSRRLNAHLAEQKLKAERRREARAAKAALAQADVVYHHVPAVAAAAFERTTTPDIRRQSHKLASVGVKSHLEKLSLEDPHPEYPTTNLKKTQAMDQAILERQILLNRNQFQWTHELEEAAEADMEREIYRPPQRTFQSEFAHLTSAHKRSNSRPLSTGDLWEKLEAQSPPPPRKSKPAPIAQIAKDRHDWVERDEEIEITKKKDHSRTSPFLRKMESTWMLGKREKIKQDRDEAGAGLGDHGSPPDGAKGIRGSFLARFKRHPS
ncbi:hypothetical protein N431DRAFT_200845 [Stipitochalara longipes BDJ]|nr:hypothetical protein N431DRAFT_200845 [Stipitochalara longipes BDJ]